VGFFGKSLNFAPASFAIFSTIRTKKGFFVRIIEKMAKLAESKIRNFKENPF